MRSYFASIAITAFLLALSGVGVHAQEAYTIPDTLTPLSEWRNGYSADETLRFRRAYGDHTLTEGADDGAYAITHLSEVLPVALVHRNGQVSMLESAPRPEIAEVIATTALGTMTLRAMMDDKRSRMRAIVVVHKGKVVFEEYLGIRPWDNHIWSSAAKSLNGLMAHLLVEEGLLDLTKPVASYLPELTDTAWADIPVSEVLHQRSGLDIREISLGEPGHPTTTFYATFAGAAWLPEDASFLDAIAAAGKLREPGQLFEYSSMNTYVIGMIAEKLTGRPFHDLVTERIWSKGGMEGDAELGLSPSGEPSAFGIFASRLRDFARYGLLYTPSWHVVGRERVVSEKYLSRVYAASKPEIFPGDNLGDRMIADFGETGLGASYQWDAVFPDGDLYKSGRGGQCLYISPETDTVVVWFSAAYRGGLWVHAYAREIVKQVFRSE